MSFEIHNLVVRWYIYDWGSFSAGTIFGPNELNNIVHLLYERIKINFNHV